MCASIRSRKKHPRYICRGKTLNKFNTDAIDKLFLPFRNVPYVANADRPYTDYKQLCELDRAKGLEVGSPYLNDKNCSYSKIVF